MQSGTRGKLRYCGADSFLMMIASYNIGGGGGGDKKGCYQKPHIK